LVGDFFAAGAADGAERIVIDFAAGDDWNFRVEQLRKTAQDAALRLAAQTEQDEIVTERSALTICGTTVSS